MLEQLDRHLTDDALFAFGAGELDDALAEAVVAHLEKCPECCEKATGMSGDPLLQRLRAASAETPLANLPGPLPRQVSHTIERIAFPELDNHPQYEVLCELSRGELGVVYLARNKLMERREVLKVLNRKLLSHLGAGDQLLRDARALAQLIHEHIVRTHSAWICGDLLVIAMESADGEALSTVVETHGPLPLIDACYYVQQAAWGLQHAFEKGIVHRHVRPQNLLVAHSGKTKHIVKILNFGLAKARREDSEMAFGVTGFTPDYTAPEQMQEASTPDMRGDIYSLGCTLYFLLTGSPPIKVKSLFDLLQPQLGNAAVPLHKVREGIPRDVAAIVSKMMAQTPKNRYQEHKEVALALAPFATPTRKVEHKKSLNQKVLSLLFRS